MRFLAERNAVLQVAKDMSDSGMVIGTWGNVSARAGEETLVIITPSGMDYAVLQPEDLNVVNLSGEIVAGKYKPSIETPLHLAIYDKRPDVGGIVHVHSLYASAFAVAKRTIPVVLEETAQMVGDEIPVAPYAECGTNALAELVSQIFSSQKKAVLLANHGLVCVGKNVQQALKVALVVEKTAQVTLLAGQLGQIYTLTTEETKSLHKKTKYYEQKK